MAHPPKTIGFVGGSGQMGRMFQALFERDGYRVLTAGRRTELTYEALAEQADVVIVTVPIPYTAEIIARVGAVMSESQLLSDLTSVKVMPVRAMLKTPASVIGCHPVFGPVPDPAGQNVVLCPARPGPFLDWYADWFRGHGMHVEVLDAQAHDDAMGAVQGLTHFMQIAYAHALRRQRASAGDLLRVSSPIHRAMFALTSRVMSGDPELYGAIQRDNPASAAWVSHFFEAAEELRNAVADSDPGTFDTLYQEAAAHLDSARELGLSDARRVIAALGHLSEPATDTEESE